jgi:hypothetical protein
MIRRRKGRPSTHGGFASFRLPVGLAFLILWGCGTVDPGTNDTEGQLDPLVFAASIQPMLDQRGCSQSQCHYRDKSNPNSGGPGGGFHIFNCEEDPCSQDELNANFDSASGMVNFSSPGTSKLLEKPLAEFSGGIQHLGGDVFLDTTDPDYQTLLAWCQTVL